MDLEHLRQNLMAAARSQSPPEQVPYAFEKRIMARLTTNSSPDAWTVWGSVLWRAAMPCVALTCALMLWAILSGGLGGGPSLATDLETAVLAPFNEFALENTW
jgi:hypothetical protein